ncbi:MAG: hypothetical protein ACLFMO_07475 [Eubacteriales bacterium]
MIKNIMQFNHCLDKLEETLEIKILLDNIVQMLLAYLAKSCDMHRQFKNSEKVIFLLL